MGPVIWVAVGTDHEGEDAGVRGDGDLDVAMFESDGWTGTLD